MLRQHSSYSPLYSGKTHRSTYEPIAITTYRFVQSHRLHDVSSFTMSEAGLPVVTSNNDSRQGVKSWGRCMQQPFAIAIFITSNRFGCIQYFVETLGVESTAARIHLTHSVSPSSPSRLYYGHCVWLKIVCWKHKTQGIPSPFKRASLIKANIIGLQTIL